MPEINDREDIKDISPPSESDKLIAIKNYDVVEEDNDTTLLYIDESISQDMQRLKVGAPYATVLSCKKCRLAPTYKKFENTTLPPSLSRRFSIYCHRCNFKPISMFTLEGMITYYNSLRS